MARPAYLNLPTRALEQQRTICLHAHEHGIAPVLLDLLMDMVDRISAELEIRATA